MNICGQSRICTELNILSANQATTLSSPIAHVYLYNFSLPIYKLLYKR